MYTLEHHRKVATILDSLDSGFLARCRAYFGGGTLLALKYGEYRWSKDIDFICPVGEGYRALRAALMDEGLNALFHSRDDLEFPRDIKADQYGVRFPVRVDGTIIKFEIVAEARITLNPPEYPVGITVPCLDFADSCAEKLLANADRWDDSSVESRDLIDLAVLRQQGVIPASAFDKAEIAYRVRQPFRLALTAFAAKPAYRRSCFQSLQISRAAYVMDGLDLLMADAGLPPTVREDHEKPADWWLPS
jgi:hypothetical protein